MANGTRDDGPASARAARLRYSSDLRPGISRRRAGGGFSYRRPDGTIVSDAAVRARIAALAIPPAWTDVWICPDPAGHLQATGRDARGRKQYRYHARWRVRRDDDKFDRLIDFADVLPLIRERVDADLARSGLPREKVLAAIVRLLELTLIRVGNDEYARLNRSFGLTTLQDRHARVTGASVRMVSQSTWPRTTSMRTCARSQGAHSRQRTFARGLRPCSALRPCVHRRTAAARLPGNGTLFESSTMWPRSSATRGRCVDRRTFIPACSRRTIAA